MDKHASLITATSKEICKPIYVSVIRMRVLFIEILTQIMITSVKEIAAFQIDSVSCQVNKVPIEMYIHPIESNARYAIDTKGSEKGSPFLSVFGHLSTVLRVVFIVFSFP